MVVDFVDESRALTEEDLHAACDGTDGSLLKALGLALRRMHETPVPEELEAFLTAVGGSTVGWGGPHLAQWLHYAEERRDETSDGDLAVLAMGCNLTPKEEGHLLSAYLNHEATPMELVRFKAPKMVGIGTWGVPSTARLQVLHRHEFPEVPGAAGGLPPRGSQRLRRAASTQDFCRLARPAQGDEEAGAAALQPLPPEPLRSRRTVEEKSMLRILHGRIFVSIVAYCDPELPATLRALLAQAAVPERLRVGLVWQGDGEAPVPQHLWRDAASSARADAACQRTLTLPTGKLSVTLTQGGHLRIINMRPEDARGPCWARYLAQLMWEGEELYLQLDSHMRFVKDWDLKAREQLLHCRSRCLKPVLCSYGRAYPYGLAFDEIPGSITGCLNCAAFFDQHDAVN
eukprot:g30681.t1